MGRQESILVVGGESFLGQGLVHHFESQGIPTWHTTRRTGQREPTRIVLDLSLPLEGFHFERQFSLAFVCAGVSSVRACAEQSRFSYQINVTHTLALIEMLLSQKAFVVYPSSSYVFDGLTLFPKPDAPLCPVTEYGRQKAAIESSLGASLGRVAIVRLTKVVHPLQSVLARWIRELKSGQSVQASAKGSIAPLASDFAVKALAEIGRRRYGGVTQVSSRDELTYLEAARYLARRVGRDASAVLTDPMADDSLPLHAGLDVSRFEGEIGMKVPSATEALDAIKPTTS